MQKQADSYWFGLPSRELEGKERDMGDGGKQDSPESVCQIKLLSSSLSQESPGAEPGLAYSDGLCKS